MPPRLRLMVLLAATCNLRFGEVTELRRSDFDLAKGVVHVRRSVVYSRGEFQVKPPKSRASWSRPITHRLVSAVHGRWLERYSRT